MSETTTKRVNWWELGEQAMCPKCKVPCTVRWTEPLPSLGKRIQYRRCPQCKHRLQTVVPTSKP